MKQTKTINVAKWMLTLLYHAMGENREVEYFRLNVAFAGDWWDSMEIGQSSLDDHKYFCGRPVILSEWEDGLTAVLK